MANWCVTKVEVVGPDLERVRDALNARRLPLPNTDPQKYHFVGGTCHQDEDPNSATDYLILDMGGDVFGLGDEVDGKPCIMVEGSRKWSPPTRLVADWSKEFSDHTFYLHYRVESMWDAGTIRFVADEGVWTEHYVGWFRAMLNEVDAPIHHWVANLEGDPDKIKQLYDERKIFKAETAQVLGEYAFRCAPEELLKEGVTFNGNPVPYTLDEETYLASVIDNAIYAARRGTEVCTCNVPLTDEERRFLKEHGVREIYGFCCDAREAVEMDAKDEYRHILQSMLGVYSTRPQLALLLEKPDLTEERRKEITSAMNEPAWLKVWPQWTKEMTPETKPQEPLLAEADFLEELKNMK